MNDNSIFPKLLENMSVEELAAEIEKIRAERRKSYTRRSPQTAKHRTTAGKSSDGMSKLLKGLTPEKRAKLEALLGKK